METVDPNGIDSSVLSQPLDRFMEEAYRRYAVLTILDRALPDARDGMKPGQRRILYAMGDMNLVHSLPHRKSARVVGEVLGKYHPHGDQSVYDAMVRMAQDFSMRKPLIDGQGNYGSIDGDSAAAMRYTEARLSSLGEAMLEDLEKDTVDWRPNFDGSLREPTVLPARFPNLLVNGVSGIAVGMSTNILPHNLGEVCDATVFLAKSWARRSEVAIAELMKYIPGPDLPTGGLLYRYRVNGEENKVDMIQRAYETGNATMVCQAKADIIDIGGGKSEIIVTELPYQVQKSTILERIAASRERFQGITDVRDESDFNGMRVVFEVARGTSPQEVWERLLSYTQMRSSLAYNALALIVDEAHGKASPKNMTLLDLLREFIQHRLVVITRRTKYELKRAEDRLHILEGLLKALSKIEEVIRIIRSSENTEAARTNLMAKFKLSEIQATAILDMPLRRLAALERQKLEDERKELESKVKGLKEILNSEERRLDVVVKETLDIKDKFADPRRTVIVDAAEGHQARVTVANLLTPTEPQLVMIMLNGLQRVNAKGWRDNATRNKPTSRATDFASCKVLVKPDEVVALISNRGRLWKGNAGRIKLQTTFSELGLEHGERIVGCGVVRPGLKLVLVTRSGLVKRTNAEDLNGRTEGTFAPMISLTDDKDEVVLAGIATDNAQLFVTTSGSEQSPSRTLRFDVGSVNPQVSHTAKGMAAIKMLDDPIIGGAIIEPAQANGMAILVTDKGLVKRISLVEFPMQGRGGQGVQVWKVNPTTGWVTGFTIAPLGGEVDIYSPRGRRLRLDVKDVPQATRASKGMALSTLIQVESVFGDEPIAGVTSA